jgi:APA family basic amino acid/polyamine antiporter
MESAVMTTIGTLFAFVIVCAAVCIMRRTNPEASRPFRTPWVPGAPVLGILVNFSMMYSLGAMNWLRLIIWLALGRIIYFTYSRHHSRLQNPSQLWR